MSVPVLKTILLNSIICSVLLSHNAFKDSQELSSKTNETLQNTQKSINSLDDKRRVMMAEYDVISQEIENYKIYNKQLQDIIDSQNKEKDLILRQKDEIEVTKREIMPLMSRMIDTLEIFIQKDRPFLPKERALRIETLRESMKRSDLSIAAKYRQILEAYQIEIDYGNTMEAYEGDVDGRKVEFLKVGRIALFYQSIDAKHTAVWDKKSASWKELEDSDYHISVAKGIKMARKRRTPDLLFIAVDQEEQRK